MELDPHRPAHVVPAAPETRLLEHPHQNAGFVVVADGPGELDWIDPASCIADEAVDPA